MAKKDKKNEGKNNSRTMTPNQVVKEMSFVQANSSKEEEDDDNNNNNAVVDDNGDYESNNPFRDGYEEDDKTKNVYTSTAINDALLQPAAPPPTAPPPRPPPPTAILSTCNQISYQHSSAVGATSSSSTTATTTTYPQTSFVTNYTYQQPGYVVVEDHGISPTKKAIVKTNSQGQLSRFGDVSIRPNTGETNDAYGGIGSLSEIVTWLRWSTITTCLFVAIWESWALPARMILFSWISPAKLVLGVYMTFFALLLLGVELNAPLRDNFGILYYPLGRATLLSLMSGMSFGILSSWWEVLLGVACAMCAIGYVYAFVHFPEYRRWQHYKDNTIWNDVQHVIGTTAATRASETMEWANTSLLRRATGTTATVEERQSLLV